MAIGADDEPAMGHEDRTMLEQPQEHRQLHVEDVVVGTVVATGERPSRKPTAIMSGRIATSTSALNPP